MKHKSVLQSILTGVFAILLLAASNSIVRADTTTWINLGLNGDWFTSGNWSNGVPDDTKDAFINNGGEAQILEDTGAAKSIILGDSQGDAGKVKVDGTDTILYLGTSSCRGDIYVGSHGSGVLNITDGAHVNGRAAYVAAFANPSTPHSSGTINVTGSDSILRLYNTSCTGAGLFIGRTADSSLGGTGTVDVSDGGSIIVFRDNDTDDAGVIVGGSGTLTGNGTLFMDLGESSSKVVSVFGTLAPKAGTLEIRGNLALDSTSANTLFHVTPTASDSLYVSSTGGGGNATLGGRITVIMTGTFTPGMDINLIYADGTRHDTTFPYETIIAFSSHPCFTPEIQYPDAYRVNLYLRPTCEE